MVSRFTDLTVGGGEGVANRNRARHIFLHSTAG